MAEFLIGAAVFMVGTAFGASMVRATYQSILNRDED